MSELLALEEWAKRDGLIIPELLGCPKCPWLKVNQAGYKVGAAWSDGSHAVVVRPKFAHLQPAAMLQVAWLEALSYSVRARQDEPLFAIHPNEPLIGLPQADAEALSLFLVSRYLIEVQRLLPRFRKREYRMEQHNLVGRIKGKLVFSAHLRTNLARGRQDRALCQYPVFDENNPLNRILKGALEKCRHFLGRIERVNGVPDLQRKAGTCLHVLQQVKALHNPDVETARQARLGLRGLYAPFRSALDLALYILRCEGDLFSLTPAQESAAPKLARVPPFMIDMNRLFELYVRALALKVVRPQGWDVALDKAGDPIDAIKREVYRGQYGIPRRQPDLLLADNNGSGPNRRVVEVKYWGRGNRDWLTQFKDEENQSVRDDSDVEKPRHGFFQTVAYLHLFGASRAMIVFPCAGDSFGETGQLGFEGAAKSQLTFLGIGPDPAKTVNDAMKALLGENAPQSKNRAPHSE